MLYRAFSRQATQLTLNIPVLQGLVKVNSKAERRAWSWQIENRSIIDPSKADYNSW